MSFLEIYNELLRDLLGNSYDEAANLEIWEDPVKGIYVTGVKEKECNNTEDIMELLVQGNYNRATEATDANQTSSRSHAILFVSIEHKDKDAGTEVEMRYSKLALIDLAGSERASMTNNRGIRL